MDTSARKIVVVRNAYNFVAAELRAQWLEMFSFLDKEATASVFRAVVNGPVVATASEIGLAPEEMSEFVRRASVQVACWMWSQDHNGTTIVKIAEVAVDVGRQELLLLIQRHFARLSGPESIAQGLCTLIEELDYIEKQLKVGARLACHRARRGLLTSPSADDIEAVGNAISVSFGKLSVQPLDIAMDALESACARIYELGSVEYNPGEFFLPTRYLPSDFVADAAYYELRHMLMTVVENINCR